MNIKYETMFAEIDMKDWGSFNQLCETYGSLATAQGWHDAAKGWSDLCLRHNKEFLDKYAGK